MVRFIYYVGVAFLLLQCRPYEAIENSKNGNCYSIKKQNNNTLKNDGYYEFADPMLHITKATIQRVIFYNDGFCISNFEPNYYEETKNKYFGFYRRGTYFGNYEISHDTIKAHFVESPGGMSWGNKFIWYKIIDSNTIKEIAFKYREPIQNNDLQKYDNLPYRKNISSGKFVKHETLPNPDKSWLKNEKWFWCDEKQYKQWKETQHK